MASSKEEVKEESPPDIAPLIYRLLSKMGSFQFVLLILLCANSSIVSINHTLTSFHTYTPAFVCESNNNDSTCAADECPEGFTFFGDSTSIVTEWSLVCARRLYAPMVNTLYFVGVTMGAIICGSLADIWGRRIMVLSCLYLQAVFGASLYFVGSFELFIVLRTLQGFFVQGVQSCTYALMIEYCPPNKRTMAGVIWELFWGLGLCILGLLSYLIPNWRYLQLALAAPSVLTLLYFWIIPESVCWLLATKQYRKAYVVLLKVARRNKDYTIVEDCKNMSFDTCDSSDDAGKKVSLAEDKSLKEKASIVEIMKNNILRKHALIMMGVWFAVTLSYYGILFYLPNLSGDRHANFLIGAAVEILAYIVAYFVLSQFGRRIPMALYQFSNGIFCILIAVLSLGFSDERHAFWKDPLLIFLALTAKGLTVSAFCGMFIYAGELFPTICRAAAFGLCGFFARIGSLTAPQLMLLGDVAFESLPMIIMGVIVFCTGIGTLYLPETLNTELPNTFDDARKMWS